MALVGPSFSLRSEYFYGPFSLNFSGAAFVNIYVKHKTMGNFGSLGSGILNANTKCSLRGKRFSPVCFNWPESLRRSYCSCATVPSIKSLQQTGTQTVFRRYWVKGSAISKYYNSRRSSTIRKNWPKDFSPAMCFNSQ